MPSWGHDEKSSLISSRPAWKKGWWLISMTTTVQFRVSIPSPQDERQRGWNIDLYRVLAEPPNSTCICWGTAFAEERVTKE